jgi:hypothetical protein
MCRGRLGPARAVGSVDEQALMFEATGQAEGKPEGRDPKAERNPKSETRIQSHDL